MSAAPSSTHKRRPTPDLGHADPLSDLGNVFVKGAHVLKGDLQLLQKRLGVLLQLLVTAAGWTKQRQRR